jgi:hypothetical protein
MYNILAQFQHEDGTWSNRTFTVLGRTVEQAIQRGRDIIRRHLAANRYKDGKFAGILKIK